MARLSYITLIAVMNVLMCVLAEEVELLYSDQYDYVDVKAALDNKEMREAYYNCFMELAPCQTPEQRCSAMLTKLTVGSVLKSKKKT
ncbi:PREDICTED: uncharacterized protein LOC105458642 [Wasmannia auropunctata]|uniref:uncharacterized protein LOC105458642 n=1 Tax=Wasmannia auropunctata TaxID=64793 RepID=UPI0005EDD88D|nr:PREDICTED: uncharacterized protein LOC105458642 [Wasmannia auropunctata]